jgi:hypothetical protein
MNFGCSRKLGAKNTARPMPVRVSLDLCRAGRDGGCSWPRIGTRLRPVQPRRTCDRDKGSFPLIVSSSDA